jgi:hypothetical protein
MTPESSPVSAGIDAGLVERVRVLEAQVDAVIRALHLTTVAAKPASEWLDATLAKINPGPFDTAIPPDACIHGYPPANSDGTCPSCGRTRPTSPGAAQ